jgi:hypothetical protein
MIGILFLMVILRIPYMFLDVPLLQPELVWMLTGERLAQGFSMYVDIIDDNGPLSAGVYWLIHILVGKSILAYQLVAGLIILFQIFYINSLFIQYKAFEENTYIPALVMTVLFHLSFDLLTLSPALMGTTFIFLALGQLFSQTIRHQDNPEPVLLVGLFGGIALCFHFPLIVFLPFVLVAGVAITGFNLHQLVLCLMGYLLPFSLCAVYYFWIDGLDDLLFEFIFATRLIDTYQHVSYWDILCLFALPLIFSLIGFILGTVLKRLTVNQQKQNQLIILFLIFSVLSIVIANRRTPYQLVVILPGMAYFISQIFIYVKRMKWQIALFYLFFIGVPSIGYGWVYFALQSDKFESYGITSDSRYQFTRNAKILVLGKDLGYYQNASLAGPFLNFHLSKRMLSKSDDNHDITRIYRIFIKEKPEYIIDQEGIFATLVEAIPELNNYYSSTENGVYQLRPS